MITRAHRNESRADHLLREWRECTRRSAHAYTLSRLRVLEGNRGAAIFYQLEAAKYHRYAVTVRMVIMQPPSPELPPVEKLLLSSMYGVLRDPDATPLEKRLARQRLNSQYGKFVTGPREYNYTTELLDPTNHAD